MGLPRIWPWRQAIFDLTLGQDQHPGENVDRNRWVIMLVRTLSFRLAMVFGMLLMLGAEDDG
jgi:hypothetical protein